MFNNENIIVIEEKYINVALLIINNYIYWLYFLMFTKFGIYYKKNQLYKFIYIIIY